MTDTTVYIQKLDFPQRISERTLTVEEAREQVALNYTDFINFEGVISKKSFAHNISNFKCVGAPFGTNSKFSTLLSYCNCSSIMVNQVLRSFMTIYSRLEGTPQIIL